MRGCRTMCILLTSQICICIAMIHFFPLTVRFLLSIHIQLLCSCPIAAHWNGENHTHRPVVEATLTCDDSPTRPMDTTPCCKTHHSYRKFIDWSSLACWIVWNSKDNLWLTAGFLFVLEMCSTRWNFFHRSFVLSEERTPSRFPSGPHPSAFRSDMVWFHGSMMSVGSRKRDILTFASGVIWIGTAKLLMFPH